MIYKAKSLTVLTIIIACSFFSANLEAVRVGKIAVDKAMDKCSSSDPCRAVVELTQAVSAKVSSSVSSAVEEAKVACSSSESCRAAIDRVTAASAKVKSSLLSLFSQTAEMISNQKEMWRLEKNSESLKKQIQNLKENTYTGQIIENIQDHSWLHEFLNWSSGGVVELIFKLEEELENNEARLWKLKETNE